MSNHLTIIEPTPIPAGPAVPLLGRAEFATQAYAYTVWLSQEAVPKSNGLAQNVYTNAQQVAHLAAEVGSLTQRAEHAVTLAEAAAVAASSSVAEWSASAVYSVGDLVFHLSEPGVTFRRTTPGGGALPPRQDAANWAPLGDGGAAADPTKGTSQSTPTFNADGYITREDFVLDGRPGSVVYGYDAENRLITVTTTWNAFTRVEMLTYSVDAHGNEIVVTNSTRS